MKYFENALNEYNQFGVSPFISYTTGAVNQLVLDEPILVVWTKEYEGVNVTSYDEYLCYIDYVNKRCNDAGINPSTQMPHVISVMTESHLVNEFMETVMIQNDEEKLISLSKFNPNRCLHSKK